MREPRRWQFADCVFDEADWSLTVAGRRVHIESKPMEILRALLLRPGCVVSKDELLDLIWPDVTVVEASLPTAVRKLRIALGRDRDDCHLVETVPGIGYRLAVPAKLIELQPPAGTDGGFAPTPTRSGRRTRSLLIAAAIMCSGAGAWAVYLNDHSAPWQAFSDDQQAQIMALRKLDLDAIERMLDEGWDPNLPYDREGTDALMYALNICEWDPHHDQRKLLMVARTLLEAGDRYDRRNAFGDTAYSIAKAPRYCGPDHPVTVMLRRMCSGTGSAPKAACLADYRAYSHRRTAAPPAAG